MSHKIKQWFAFVVRLAKTDVLHLFSRSKEDGASSLPANVTRLDDYRKRVTESPIKVPKINESSIPDHAKMRANTPDGLG